ncbi:MAG: hypothetical protein CVU05_13470, partial [Bacteroidetes bacterium HGW-Bacteroidetes-21]
MFRKIIKKRDIAIFFGTLFLLLYLFIFLVLKSPTFQSYLATKVATWLSKEINAPVSIGSVDFSPFFNCKINQVFLGDQKGDTIAYIPELNVFIRNISLSKKKVEIGTVDIIDPVIKVMREEGVSRYRFLMAYFKGDTTKKDSSTWKVSFLKLNLENATIAYRATPYQDKDWGISFRDVLARNVCITADEFSQEADTLFFHLHSLSLEEKSGFVISQIAAHVRVEPERLVTDKLSIITPSSKIFMDDFSMRYTSLEDFEMFEENVRMTAKIRSSLISLKDISYMSSYLKGLDENVLLSGEFKGTVASFRGKNVAMKLLDNTVLLCDFSINGLPDVDNAFWHFDFHRFNTTIAEIEKIPLPPFDSKKRLDLPAQVGKFGKVYYQGKFSGFLTDFVAFGSFKTNLGVLRTDVSLKQDSIHHKMVVKGKLSSPSIMAGTLAGVTEDIGAAGFSLNADGVIFDNGNFDMNLIGEVQHIQVRQYTYKNVLVNGNVTEKLFDGELHVDDPNVKLDFTGKVDFSEKIPVYNFSCELRDMYFTRLNLFGKDSMAHVNLNMDAHFEGNDLDNINGELSINGFDYSSSKNKFASRSIEIYAFQESNQKDLSLKSDVADIGISGHFSFKNVADAVMLLVAEYFPSLQDHKVDDKVVREIESSAYFCDFDIYTGKSKGFLDEFVPGLVIAENSHCTGSIDLSNSLVEFEAASTSLKYNDMSIEGIELLGKAFKKTFTLGLSTIAFKQGKTFTADNLNLSMNGHTDTAFVELGWENNDTLSFAGNLSGMVRFFRSQENKPAVAFESSPSLLILADTTWYINEGVLTYVDTTLFIDHLILNHDQQYIYANGSLGKNDTLSLIISGLNLNNVNAFIADQGYDLQGIMTGTAEISGGLNALRLTSDFEIDKLVVNGEDLGKTISKATYNNDLKRVDVTGTMHRGVIKTISYAGYVTTLGDIDFELELNRVRMKIFEPFMVDIVSDLKGDISGVLKIVGKTASPDVSGILKVQKASFLVDYLQTRYNFTGDVNVTRNSFEVKELRLYDVNGNFADVTGKVTHKDFKDIQLLFQITPQNFLVLNTKASDNELFYGKALASGIVDVTGNLDNINLNINVKTEKNTRFFIPLTSTSEVSQNDFITFVSAKTGKPIVEEKKS